MPDEVKKLSNDEVQAHLKNVPDWEIDKGELQRRFSLPTFPAAIFFVNAVAHLAEVSAHHPDIIISYNNVTLRLSTHSAGGLTEKDFASAQQVNALWNVFHTS